MQVNQVITTAGQTVTVSAAIPASQVISTASQTVTVTATAEARSPQQQQAQNANSVTIDFIGTLPVSPLIFGACCFGIGAFIMMIASAICCRNRPSHARKDEEYEGGMTTNLNTTSHPTYTSTIASMR